MPNRHYIACAKCTLPVRVDDGSFKTRTGKRCEHLGGTPHRNSESSMVIFRFADGRISVPWEPGSKVPAGAVREEVRGARAVRKLEREMDAKDLSKHRHYEEKLERMMEPVNASMRAGLRRQMANARTPFERDYVRGVLDRLERKPATSGYEAGNHRD